MSSAPQPARTGLWSVFTCIAALSVPQMAHASLITYSFESVVSDIFLRGGVVPTGLSEKFSDPFALVGEPISGSITVNDMAIDTDSDPNFGFYENDVAPQFSIFFAGEQFVSDPSTILLTDLSNPGDLVDRVSFISFLPSGSLASDPSFSFNLGLRHFSDGSLFMSDAVPSDLTALPGTFELALSFMNSDSTQRASFLAQTKLTRTAAIPEPSTWAMVGIGLMGLIWARTRRGPVPGTEARPA